MPKPRAQPAEVGFGGRFVVATSIGSVLNPVNSSIIAVALVSISATFGVGSDVTVWLVSVLYLATAIGQPTMGRLADLVGPRRIYLAGTAMVAVGGVLGYVGWSLGTLVVARAVLGLGTSAAYPAAMAIVRRQAEQLGREPPGSVLGALAITGQVSMAVGPPLGGLLIAAGGWRLTFLVNLPLALVGVVSVLAWIPPDDPGRRPAPSWRSLDLAGLGLFAAALTALLVFLMDLASPRWWLLGVTIGLIAALAGRERRVESPFLDVRMLVRNRALTTTYVRYGVTMLINYCFVYGWTQWLEQSAGFATSAAGLLLMPSFLAAALVSTLASRSRRVWGPLVAGTAAVVVGSGALLLLEHDTGVWALVGISVIFGVQNGLSVVTNQAAMYAQAPSEAIGTAAGLLRTFMFVGAIAFHDPKAG